MAQTLYPVKMTKATAKELVTKLDGILGVYELTEGSFGTEAELEALCTKVEAHAATTCRQPIMLTTTEASTLADELDNSADALYDNGYKSVANRYHEYANVMRESAMVTE